MVAIYKSYIRNYDSVKEYASSDLPLKFIEIVTNILNIDDLATLREIYHNTNEYYKASDIMTILSIMKDAYNKEISQSIQGKQEGTNVTKVFKDADGNDVSLEMTELLDDFGILVHSTCAYGEMPLIDGNYFKSWNYNPNTENHGICCSYITNSSYGTANVTGSGVMFGFTRLNENSVAIYSPYDLVTINNGFTIDSRRNPYYTKLDDISSTTRHTHNEFDLERRNDSIENRYPCIQPDCIIIFEDMPDEIKANSIKAYNDFKEQGIELKLIYMDRKKIATNEASKVRNMINMFKKNHDLSLLKEIINKYESNICGMDFMQGVDKDSLFMTNEISNILHNEPNYIMSINDLEERNNKIVEFIDILEQEQYKFDLVEEQIGNRGHRFLLYDDILKEQIENLRQLLNQTYAVNKEAIL
jgi:hypothetical protein